MRDTLKRILRLAALLGLVGTMALSVIVYAAPGYTQETASKGHLPRLAGLMNEAMQVHHTKLWLAGHAKNWDLAGYELNKIKDTIAEIKETIVDIQTTSPQWRSMPVGEMLRGIDSSLNVLDQAIKAKDPSAFEAAYSGLTASCNACHARAGQSQVKIIVPTTNGAGAFTDQDFTTGGNSN
jgi:hypothetical protein